MNTKILIYTITIFIFTACGEPTISNKAKNTHIFTHTWINPSAQACIANGGKINAKGICESNLLKEAKAICKSEGNDVPTIEQIIKFSSECGAVPVPYKGKKSKFFSYIQSQRNKNTNNQAYQQCIESQGINVLHPYITKTAIHITKSILPGYKVRTFRFRSADVNDEFEFTKNNFYKQMEHKPTTYPKYIICIKEK